MNVIPMPQVIEDIAHVAHEANRAYCQTLGDLSQPSWDEASAEQKNSVLQGVLAVQANPDRTPQQNHEGWMALKMMDGWTYGLVKDVGKKVHPCLVPYSELPYEQRLKNELFLAVVKTLLPVNVFLDESPQ